MNIVKNTSNNFIRMICICKLFVCCTKLYNRTFYILKRAVGHTPKSKTLDEVYLHPKANQMIEAFDSANQLVKDEVLALPEE